MNGSKPSNRHSSLTLAKTMGRLDYIQAEAMVVAFMSEAELLIDDFHKGSDIHSRTTEQLFGIPYDEVRQGYVEGDPEMKMKRYFGKKCRHAFNYRMSKRRLKEGSMRDLSEQLSPAGDRRWREALYRLPEVYTLFLLPGVLPPRRHNGGAGVASQASPTMNWPATISSGQAWSRSL